MNFLKEKYPQIYALYIEYISTKKYEHHPLTEYSENNTSRVVDVVTESAKSKSKIDDIITTNATVNECIGFIHGFSTAMNILKGCGVK